MKKIAVFLAFFSMVAFLPIHSVKCEEIGENEPQIEEETPITEDDVLAMIKDKLGAIGENGIVLDILAWLRDAGILSALAVVLTKYRKYKGKSVGEIVEGVTDKVKSEVDKTLKDNVDKINALADKVDELQKLLNTFTKALILLQDDTAKGKLALLEFLKVNTDTDVTEVKEQVEQEVEQIETIKKELKQDYEDIF